MKRFHTGCSLLCLILLGAFWIGTRDPGTHLSTQVIDLLPVEERDPGVRIVRSLATTRHAQVILLLVEGIEGSAEARAATEVLRQAFEGSPLIAEGWNLDAPPIPEDALLTWTANAVPWFWAEWWEAQGRPQDAETIALTAVYELSTFLERPESSFHEDAIPEDPFLLVPRSLARLQASLPASAFQRDDPAEHTNRLRFWIRSKGSPFSAEDRRALLEWIEKTQSTLQAAIPGARIQDTGVHRFADASEQAIRDEVTRLNLMIFLLVGMICLLFLRRWALLMPLLLIVGVTLVCGVGLSLLILGQLHVLTLVVGSILIGVAVDYGLHVFLETGSTSARGRLHKMSRPLLVGGASTIGGFLVLVATELPILQQLGIFVASGLAAALAASFLYALDPRPSTEEAVRFLPAIGRWCRGKPLMVLFIVLSPLLTGLGRIQWDDDIRALDYPLPGIKQRDTAIREQFGSTNDHTSLLIGSSWTEVNKAVNGIELPIGSSTLAQWMTDAESARSAHTLAKGLNLPDALRQALEEEGFYADAFEPFFRHWQAWVEQPWSDEAFEAAVSSQFASLPGPSALLAGQDGDLHWILVQTPQGVSSEPDQGTWVPLAQLESLNAVFTRYREEAMWAACLALGVLGIGLMAGFGLRTGCAVILLPVLPAFLTLGMLSWWGQALGLFHLMGAFLSVCLSLDYIVFALQARQRGEELPCSITLSAITTGGSFACLASSAIPAVSGMGWVVACSVFLAWILALGLTHYAPPNELSSPIKDG